MADFVFMSDSGIMSVASPQAIAAKEKDYPKLNSLLGYKRASEPSRKDLPAVKASVSTKLPSSIKSI